MKVVGMIHKWKIKKNKKITNRKLIKEIGE